MCKDVGTDFFFITKTIGQSNSVTCDPILKKRE